MDDLPFAPSLLEAEDWGRLIRLELDGGYVALEGGGDEKAGVALAIAYRKTGWILLYLILSLPVNFLLLAAVATPGRLRAPPPPSLTLRPSIPSFAIGPYPPA